MKATKAVLTYVLDAYKQASNGVEAQGWISRTRSYVSVKIAGRHLSPREQGIFNELLRDEFGKEFISSANAHSKKFLPPICKDDGSVMYHYDLEPKVNARFESSYPPMKPKSISIDKEENNNKDQSRILFRGFY